MLKFEIDHNAPKPIYAQIIANIEDRIASGKLKNNDAIPSMNDLAKELGVSMETVKKAYKIMRDRGTLVSSQGLGYFVRKKDADAPYRILLLFDKLSTYKLVLYRSLVAGIEKAADITIHVHNQDLDLFESLVSSALDKYDYYIVTPHFQNPDNARLLKVLSRIPNRKLLVLDKSVEGLEGNYGMVVQSFSEDAYNAIGANIERIRKYDNIHIISASDSMYHDVILKGLGKALDEAGIKYDVVNRFILESARKGALFIVVGGQLDSEHFSILRYAREKGLKLGGDIGIISYNDSPENEFICDGLATMSTDFQEMGTTAAHMINSGTMVKVHNKFKLIPRSSL